MASERNGGAWDSNVGGLWASIRVARRGSEDFRWFRAVAISPGYDSGLGLSTAESTAMAAAVILGVCLRIFRARKGILDGVGLAAALIVTD